MYVVHNHRRSVVLSQASAATLLGWHAHDMFDHISNTIKYIVIVVLGFPHEGRGADHFVLLVHISLVKERVKVKARVISLVIFTINFFYGVYNVKEWWKKCKNQQPSQQTSLQIWFTNTDSKGYIWLTAVVAGAHALHCLHHVGVRPVPPAGRVVPLVAHSHLDVGQHAAGQHWSHAGQSETVSRRSVEVFINQD